MDAWILFSVAAALAQTLRFMVQKQITVGGLSAAGATFARFYYSAPLILVLAGIYAVSGPGVPVMSLMFWIYGTTGGLAQILATICVVALFRHRNFAVGITFKKTEVILTAVAGLLVLADPVSPVGWVALLTGLAGVLLLSDPPEGGLGPRRFFNRAAGLGLLSGVFFAISAVAYRGATLEIAGDDVILRAGWTLAMVATFQALALGGWLLVREPGQIAAVTRAWRRAGLVGLFSMAGSFCWFAAFSLQSAAYVFAVGQIEVIFSILVSVLVFRETIGWREYAGMAVLTVSILAIGIIG